MGLPALHTDGVAAAETVGAAIRGVRLALGHDARRSVGVAMYVDHAATGDGWSAYRRDWGGR
jgi:hypothetical protein